MEESGSERISSGSKSMGLAATVTVFPVAEVLDTLPDVLMLG